MHIAIKNIVKHMLLRFLHLLLLLFHCKYKVKWYCCRTLPDFMPNFNDASECASLCWQPITFWSWVAVSTISVQCWDWQACNNVSIFFILLWTEKCNTHYSGRSGAAPGKRPPSCGQTGGLPAADLRPQHLRRDLQTQHHGPAVGKSLTHTHWILQTHH